MAIDEISDLGTSIPSPVVIDHNHPLYHHPFDAPGSLSVGIQLANVVANALSRKAESMGSLAFITIGERPLTFDVQSLVNHFVRLNISEPSQVLACVVSWSSLYDCIRERQYNDPHLLVLKDTFQHDDTKDVTIGDDGMLRM
ncbi:uncharacterized protein [Nicotiana tomentosiformis]|uniref:uncharacterized protein n=1 Tax=Nicotiana tomentosiformis TaxID=4098 RepID=UPI00388C58F8